MEHQDPRLPPLQIDFRTAIKEKRDPQRPESFLQTPSFSRQHHYRPSNLKLISQHYLQKQQELHYQPQPDPLRNDIQLTFVIVARIQSIHYENSRYYLILSDETSLTSQAKFYYTKMHQPATLNNFVRTNKTNEGERVEELEFQPNKQDGHSYFRLWLKLTTERRKQSQPELCWSVQRLERILDFDFLTYHWLSIQLDRLTKP